MLLSYETIITTKKIKLAKQSDFFNKQCNVIFQESIQKSTNWKLLYSKKTNLLLTYQTCKLFNTYGEKLSKIENIIYKFLFSEQIS
jgi:hypothetical protein